MTADLDGEGGPRRRVGQNLPCLEGIRGQPFERDDTSGDTGRLFVAGGGGTNKPNRRTPRGQEGAGFGGVVYPLGVYGGAAGRRCASSRAWTQICSTLLWLPCSLTTVLGSPPFWGGGISRPASLNAEVRWSGRRSSGTSGFSRLDAYFDNDCQKGGDAR